MAEPTDDRRGEARVDLSLPGTERPDFGNWRVVGIVVEPTWSECGGGHAPGPPGLCAYCAVPAPPSVFVLLRGDGTIAGIKRDRFGPPRSSVGWRVEQYTLGEPEEFEARDERVLDLEEEVKRLREQARRAFEALMLALAERDDIEWPDSAAFGPDDKRIGVQHWPSGEATSYATREGNDFVEKVFAELAELVEGGGEHGA